MAKLLILILWAAVNAQQDFEFIDPSSGFLYDPDVLSSDTDPYFQGLVINPYDASFRAHPSAFTKPVKTNRPFVTSNKKPALVSPTSEELDVESLSDEIEDPIDDPIDDVDLSIDQNITGVSTRILNGIPVAHGVIPGFAILMQVDQYHCGGSLIARRFVLTTAECVQTLQGFNPSSTTLPSSVRIYMNTVALDPLDPGTRIRAVTRYWIHPLYTGIPGTGNIKANNVAVLRLDVVVLNVPLIRLHRGSFSLVGRRVRVYGFGGLDTADNGTQVRSTTLKRGSLRVVARSQCRWPHGPVSSASLNRYVCTSGSRIACPDDIGGPLMVGRTQIGMVAYVPGTTCSSANVPVYIRISAYRNWIRSVARAFG